MVVVDLQCHRQTPRRRRYRQRAAFKTGSAAHERAQIITAAADITAVRGNGQQCHRQVIKHRCIDSQNRRFNRRRVGGGDRPQRRGVNINHRISKHFVLRRRQCRANVNIARARRQCNVARRCQCRRQINFRQCPAGRRAQRKTFGKHFVFVGRRAKRRRQCGDGVRFSEISRQSRAHRRRDFRCRRRLRVDRQRRDFPHSRMRRRA